MSKLPSIELLESTHTFPSDYIFKVIGNADEGFLGRVLAAARESAELSADPEFSVKQTTGGKHISVTLTVHVPSAQRVHTIYEGLAKLEGLILLM
jgi:putative lipoic acid-binding regulatory protein